MWNLTQKKMKLHVKCETAVFNAPHKSRSAWPILPTSLYTLVHPRCHGLEPVTRRRHAHAKTTIRKRTAGSLQWKNINTHLNFSTPEIAFFEWSASLNEVWECRGVCSENRMDKAVLANYSSVQIQGGSSVEATGLDTACIYLWLVCLSFVGFCVCRSVFLCLIFFFQSVCLWALPPT